MTVLITERQYNRIDAWRCAMWIAEYYRQQAVADGLPQPEADDRLEAILVICRQLKPSRSIGAGILPDDG